MIATKSWDSAKAARGPLVKDTFEGFVTDFLAGTVGSVTPQAFLVEQNPNWVTPPHFHLEHQFQVVTAGRGAIGRHDVQPLCVHYATAETGYGPVVAGPDGVSYLTLRVANDTGAWYLHKPGSRERMQRGLKKLQEHGSPQSTITATELATLAAPTIETLIAPQTSGLAAHLVRLPANTTLALAAEHAHAGRYYVSTAGSIRINGVEQPALAVTFASPDETLSMQAGAQGLEVLVLQFPAEAIVRSHA